MLVAALIDRAPSPEPEPEPEPQPHPENEHPETAPPPGKALIQQVNGIVEDRTSETSTDILVR